MLRTSNFHLINTAYLQVMCVCTWRENRGPKSVTSGTFQTAQRQRETPPYPQPQPSPPTQHCCCLPCLWAQGYQQGGSVGQSTVKHTHTHTHLTCRLLIFLKHFSSSSLTSEWSSFSPLSSASSSSSCATHHPGHRHPPMASPVAPNLLCLLQLCYHTRRKLILCQLLEHFHLFHFRLKPVTVMRHYSSLYEPQNPLSWLSVAAPCAALLHLSPSTLPRRQNAFFSALTLYPPNTIIAAVT